VAFSEYISFGKDKGVKLIKQGKNDVDKERVLGFLYIK